MSRPRLVIADDHRIFAEGLERLLAEEYEIVAVVADGQALLDAVAEHGPDLVVTDLSMPELNGIECVRVLRESTPELKIVLLTMHEDVSMATAAIRAGASAYVLKHSGSEALLHAVKEALQGGVHVSSQLAAEVMRSLSSGKDEKRELTPRQLEIVRHLVGGLSAKEIAARLGLSTRTVEFHKYKAMERIGVETSAELIHYAVKSGIGPV